NATADLLAQAGVASILVTHDQNEALSFASQVAVMRQGRFAQVGTPYEVYSRPVDEETALFLGDALVLPAELRGGRARCAIGEISTDDPHAVGQGRVMLRPEQLVISPSPADGKPLTVRDVDFSGHLSTLTLAMPGQGEPLIVKTVSRQLWRPGAAVHIEVVGEARVFAR
ncbi:TOBE domain-containing protein, partial [Klebsiella michiganensis]